MYLLLLVCLVVTIVTTYILYTNTQRLFQWVQGKTDPSRRHNPAIHALKLDQIRMMIGRSRSAGRSSWPWQIRRHTNRATLSSGKPPIKRDGFGGRRFSIRYSRRPERQRKITNDAAHAPGDPYDVNPFRVPTPGLQPSSIGLSHDQWGTFCQRPRSPIRRIVLCSVPHRHRRGRVGLPASDQSRGHPVRSVRHLPPARADDPDRRSPPNVEVQVRLLADIDRQKDELSASSAIAGRTHHLLRWSLESMLTAISVRSMTLNGTWATWSTLGIGELASLLLEVSRINWTHEDDKQSVDLSRYLTELILPNPFAKERASISRTPSRPRCRRRGSIPPPRMTWKPPHECGEVRQSRHVESP